MELSAAAAPPPRRRSRARAVCLLLHFTAAYSGVHSTALQWEEQPPARAHVPAGGALLPCAAHASSAPTVQWLSADFTPLPLVTDRWRVLPNGSLQLTGAGGLPPAVRCRVTAAAAALVSRPVRLLPVWETIVGRVEAVAARAGGIAALWCKWGGAGAGGRVRWWRGEHALSTQAPTTDSRHVAAGAQGEVLLVAGAGVAGDVHYSCQPPGGERSPPAPLLLLDSDSIETPRLVSLEGPLTVASGAPVCLPCAVPLEPDAHYTWQHDSSPGLPAGTWQWQRGAALCAAAAAHAAGGWQCRAHTRSADLTARTALRQRDPLTVSIVPALTVARGGDSVRLECRTSESGARLRWLHNGAPARAGEGAAGALLLHAGLRTHGLWQCEAQHDDEVELAVAELQLAEARPELQHTFVEQALRVGARAALHCSARAQPPPAFNWLRDGMELRAGQHHRYWISSETVDGDETWSTLNVSAVAPEDGGRYSCRAANALGVAEHSARLDVYGPPLVRAVPPQRVLAGHNVTVLCPYAGYPISAVRWWRGAGGSGGVVESAGWAAAVGAEGLGGAVGGKRGAGLRLWPARAQDAGRYACSAHAPDGTSATRDIEIIILTPPKISPFMFPPDLGAGSAVRVLCSVSAGDAPLAFAWLKDGAPLSPHLQIEVTSLDDFSLLKFSKLSERHIGNYTCRVSNHAASVDYTAPLMIQVPPVWTQEPHDVSVPAGAALRVECGARGRPPPALRWQLRTAGPSTSPTLRFEGGVLSSDAATPAMRGVYTCIANNGIGSPLTKDINLVVLEPATVESNEPMNVSCVYGAETPCVLRCVARGDVPLAVTWVRAGEQPLDLHGGRWAREEAGGGAGGLRSELRLLAPAAADSGEYRCRAANSVGSSERRFFLLIDEPPAAPEQLQLWGRGATWARVSWRGDPRLPHVALIAPINKALRQAATSPLDLTLDHYDGCDSERLCAVLDGLQPGEAYSVCVRASSRAGSSSPSAPLLFTTLDDAPTDSPKNLEVTSKNSGEVDVSWTPLEVMSWRGVAIGYAVEWRELNVAGAAAGAGAGVARVLQRSGTRVTLRELSAGARYALSVRALTRAGAGPSSPAHIFHMVNVEQNTLTEMSCTSSSPYQLQVSWTSTGYSTGREVDIIYGSAPSSNLVWSEEDEIRLGVQHATAAVEARAVRVAARAGARYSVWARLRGAPPVPPAGCHTPLDGNSLPGAVPAVRATAAGRDAVRLWWRAPRSAAVVTHYTLHARDLTKSDNEWSQRVEVPLDDAGEATGVVSGLRAAARYEFWVRAHAAAGAGPAAPRLSAQPGDNPTPCIWSWPRALTAAAGTRVRLRCSAAGAGTLRRRWAPLPPRHTISPEGHLDILDMQPQWAGNYTCTVRNAAGADSVTHTVRARPAPEPPPAPRLERAALHEIHVAWDEPSAPLPIMGYSIEWQRDEEDMLESDNGDGAGVELAAADERRHALRGLRCGERRAVRVRAHTAAGPAPLSLPLRASALTHDPIAPTAEEFVWANSSALRLTLGAWGAPCPLDTWHVGVCTAGHCEDILPPRADDTIVEIGGLSAETWYELRVHATAAGGGAIVAHYMAATLTDRGERIGESYRVVGAEPPARSAYGAALLLAPAALAAAALTALAVRRLHTRRARHGGTRAPAPTPALPLPPPPPYAEFTKHSIIDLPIPSPPAPRPRAGDESDSSGDSCAACRRRAAHAPAAHHAHQLHRYHY